jgi:mannose-1-phosphate guanylyltransferase
MKAMILAAGFGTRLRPITYTLPKPMVPLCNQPLIGWAAESLTDAGIRELIVNLHHLPQPIMQYLPAAFPAAKFHFSPEHEILGTGGAIRNVAHLLESAVDFFLVNGDTVQFAPFGEMRAARQRLDALASLTLRHPPAGDHFTAVWFDGRQITGFGEGRGEALMFSGAHLISNRVFAYLPSVEFSSIVDEVYRPMVESGRESLAGVVDDGVWFDIGTPQRYISASQSMLALMRRGDVKPRHSSRITGDSLLHETATGSVTNSIVGARSVIEGDGVHDSVIWDDCHIGLGVRLERCIVAHGVEITSDVSYSNAMICRADRAIPRKPEYSFENDLVIAGF